jgi:hypothetical protein
MVQLFDAATRIYTIAGVICAVIAAVVIIRRKFHVRNCLKFVFRDQDGQLFVRDPRTNALRKLVVSIDGKVRVQSGADKPGKADRKALKRFRRELRNVIPFRRVTAERGQVTADEILKA